MATLLTPAQLKEHVETDLGNDALQRLLDDADAEIIERAGVLAAQTEVLQGGDRHLFLARRASSITSAVERVHETNTSLTVSTDLLLLSDGIRVQRLSSGAGSDPSVLWQGVVTIVYVPVSDSAQRIRVEIDLVKLALAWDGVKSCKIGDVTINSVADYQAEREKIMRALTTQKRRLLT